MINFLKTFLIVLVKQVLFLTVFGISVKINADGVILIPIALLILYIISHFLHSKKICNWLNLDGNLFNVYSCISWIIVGSYITYLIITESWIWNLLPTTGGMFSGLEYILVPIFLGAYLIVLGIIKFILFVITKLKKSK